MQFLFFIVVGQRNPFVSGPLRRNFLFEWAWSFISLAITATCSIQKLSSWFGALLLHFPFSFQASKYLHFLWLYFLVARHFLFENALKADNRLEWHLPFQCHSSTRFSCTLVQRMQQDPQVFYHLGLRLYTVSVQETRPLVSDSPVLTNFRASLLRFCRVSWAITVQTHTAKNHLHHERL